MKKLMSVCALAAVLGASMMQTRAEDPPPPKTPEEAVARVLEHADADIEELKKLDYASVDLEKVDLPTKTMAIMALNNLLATHRERARFRTALLEDYIAARNLNDEFSTDSSSVPERKTLSLDDGMRLAVVLVRTPEGQDSYLKQVAGVKDATLQRVYSSYRALANKAWGEVVYARFRVTEMATFLERKGMLNDFLAWAKDEVAAKKAVHQQQVLQQREIRKQEDAAARAKRIADQQAWEDRQHEVLMRKFDDAYYYDNGYRR